jgi:hypothetical protein
LMGKQSQTDSKLVYCTLYLPLKQIRLLFSVIQ